MSFPYEIQIPDVPGGLIYESTESVMMISSLGMSKYAVVPMGVYNNLTWNPQDPPLGGSDITTWGTKMLPGAGPFYFSNNEAGTPTLAHLDIEPNPAADV